MANGLVPRPKVTTLPGIPNAVVQCHAAERFNSAVAVNGKTYLMFEAQEGDIAISGDEGDYQYRSELRVYEPTDDVGSDDLRYWGFTLLLPGDFPSLVDPVTNKRSR